MEMGLVDFGQIEPRRASPGAFLALSVIWPKWLSFKQFDKLTFFGGIGLIL